MKAVGVVFSNIHDKYVPELTSGRTMASVPYGGRYRLIDFVLSNMVNSNIEKVGVITKSNYQSLMDHIGSGKDWDLTRKNAGIILLPPFGGTDSNMLYRTRLEALKGIISFLMRCTEDYVIMTDADKVLNIDYADVISFHESKGAEITVVYKETEVDHHSAQQSIIYTVDDTDRVTEVSVYPSVTGKFKVCQNIFLLKRQLLIDEVVSAMSNGFTSFHRHVLAPSVTTLKIFAYRFEGYSATIDSLTAFYRSNMDLLDKNTLNDVFGIDQRPVYTKVRDSAPAKYYEGAKAVNSLIADGCEIHGTVENSILFRGVKVGKGAVIKDSIIMQDSVVGERAVLNAVITDKNVYIGDRKNLSGCEALPYFIGKNTRL